MPSIPFFLAIATIFFVFIVCAIVIFALFNLFSNTKKVNEKKNIDFKLDLIDKSILIIASLFITIGFIFLLHAFSIWEQFNNLNEIGDYIGGTVGTFWAFSGTLLFLLALKLQRDDLNLTKIEMRNQVIALEGQTTEFEIKRVTETIFKQIDLINNYLQNFQIVNGPNHHRGSTEWRKLASKLSEDGGGVKIGLIKEVDKIRAKILFHFEQKYQLLDVLYTSYRVVINSTDSSFGISIEEKKRLKYLFKSNLSDELWSIVSNLTIMLEKAEIKKEKDLMKKLNLQKIKKIINKINNLSSN